ncbi:MAG: hypothetical protein C0402_10780 [Thermodesulfovibrio sp.]|nr:hypothetical protein [Thermodesulfovibrio sp.]
MLTSKNPMQLSMRRRIMNKLLRGLILIMLMVASAGAVWADTAVPVSPGGAGTSDACPTFSWGPGAGALSYELSAYEALSGDALSREDMDARTGRPVLSHRVPAPALSWTPSSGQCLGEGSYVWYVRGLDAQGHGQWSQGVKFEVELTLSSAAFEERVAGAVEKYLARQQSLAAGVQANKPMYEIVETAKAADPQSLQKTPAPVDAITPNATPTAGASIYLEGDVSLAKTGGRVGIGTDAIAAGLHVTSSDGVLFEGTYGQGTIPKEGPGERMMWYPKKAAFRAGSAYGQAGWDDVNIGLISTAIGAGTTASGVISTAMGYFTTASGDDSTAMGVLTTASGGNSTAMGYVTTASAGDSTAMGSSTTASDWASTAMGFSTTASGMVSTAMGFRTTASGFASTAMGADTTAASCEETVIGRYNNPVFGNVNSWVPTDRLFVIGNGTSDAARSDAVVVLKNGNVGIGSGAPTVKLDVAGSVKANYFSGDGSAIINIPYGSITQAPKVRAYFTTLPADVTSGNSTSMGFDTDSYNIGDIHNTAVNPSLFTVPVTGYYRMSAIIWFQTNATGFRQVYLKQGGTTNVASAIVPAVTGANTQVVVTTTGFMNAGDYVEVMALQNSGSSLSIGSGDGASHFAMEYVP